MQIAEYDLIDILVFIQIACFSLAIIFPSDDFCRVSRVFYRAGWLFTCFTLLVWVLSFA